MERIAGVFGRNLDRKCKSLLGSIDHYGDCSLDKVKFDNGFMEVLSSESSKIIENSSVYLAFDGLIYEPENLSNYAQECHWIIQKYLNEGIVSLLKSINGDFSFCLYDKNKEYVYLARDRFGLRPLYYFSSSDELIFCSRIRGILEYPKVPIEENPVYAGLILGSHYRTFDARSIESPYRQVSQLPAAHFLKFEKSNVTVQPYWSLGDCNLSYMGVKSFSDRYREELFRAIKVRLNRTSSEIFTLSGGMDSSSVLAFACAITGDKQPAVSTVYVDKTYDESEDIKSILGKCVSNWREVKVDEPDIFKLIPEIIRQHDEPIITATWLPHYLMVKELQRDGYRTVYGGLGGDELNAGEFEHFFYFFADLFSQGKIEKLETEMAGWVRHHDHPIFKKSREIGYSALKRLVDINTPGKCLPDYDRMLRYSSALNSDYFNLQKYVQPMPSPFRSYLKNRCYQDIFLETLVGGVRAQDRNGSYFGLIHVLPFLDHKLAEFMFSVPIEELYDQGVTKSLLRKATAGVLPEETRTRIKKTGWNAPAHIWFASPTGIESVREVIGSSEFQSRSIYNVKRIEELLEEHVKIIKSGAQQDNHMMFFWQVINLEYWFRYNDSLRSKRKELLRNEK